MRLEVGKVRGEVEKVCGEIEKLRGETKSRETRLILWVGGIIGTVFIGLVGVMAKGFGWLGF